MRAFYQKYFLQFKRPGGTSRGVLHTKETFFLYLEDQDRQGIGECGLFRGLSADDRPDYEATLQWVCDHINLDEEALFAELSEFPSIQFGLEQAFRSLEGTTMFELFSSDFTKGKEAIAINGLIWMGTEAYMKEQIALKLEEGYTTLKLKIGAIDFNTELELIKAIRKEYTPEEVEIRVDANGAFLPQEAMEKLKRLSDYGLHSIEQPIRSGQPEEMAALCERTPLPIALDEELIGVFAPGKKASLLENIKPQYIILKPSLIGGFKGSKEWIALAEKNGAGWWITSALESNVGLNAIAQFTYTLKTNMPQGLGTGSLFTNNIESPLEVHQGFLYYNTNRQWNLHI